MLATRNFFKRNRTNFAVGAGIVGGAYVATQYVLGKLTEAKDRLATDRIAKEKYVIWFPQISILPSIQRRLLYVLIIVFW